MLDFVALIYFSRTSEEGEMSINLSIQYMDWIYHGRSYVSFLDFLMVVVV